MQGENSSNQFNVNQPSNLQNGQNSERSNNATNQNSQSTEIQQPSFRNGEQPFEESNSKQASFLIKNLHTGIVGLISGIGLFVLTGTGLTLSIFLWNNKRKRNKKNRTVSILV